MGVRRGGSQADLERLAQAKAWELGAGGERGTGRRIAGDTAWGAAPRGRPFFTLLLHPSPAVDLALFFNPGRTGRGGNASRSGGDQSGNPAISSRDIQRMSARDRRLCVADSRRFCPGRLARRDIHHGCLTRGANRSK